MTGSTPVNCQNAGFLIMVAILLEHYGAQVLEVAQRQAAVAMNDALLSWSMIAKTIASQSDRVA